MMHMMKAMCMFQSRGMDDA